MGDQERESRQNPGGSTRAEEPDVRGSVERPGRRAGKPGASSRSARRYGSRQAGARQSDQDVLRGPPGVDLAAIEAELLAEYDWLLALERGQEVVEIAALRVAWSRVAMDARERAEALPDPDATIVSADKDAWSRARRAGLTGRSRRSRRSGRCPR